jgi:hypothetical protein
MEEATTNLSATEITQLTGLIVGEGFKRMANKTETVKRFVNVLEANATGDILQIAKEILGEADFNQRENDTRPNASKKRAQSGASFGVHRATLDGHDGPQPSERKHFRPSLVPNPP